MPLTRHTEKHFTATETVRDIVIGMSDGLTVPFALAAGLTGAITASGLIVTAGLAEITAGSIAMGLGGYLAARGDAEHYASEKRREEREVHEIPDDEAREVSELFQKYGLSQDEAAPIVAALRRKPEAWVDFMMAFELGLERPEPRRAFISAVTIAGAYIVGGFIPLLPYFLVAKSRTALLWSAGVTLIALFVFGVLKGKATGTAPLRSGVQTILIGGIAAATAFGIARIFSNTH
jgi:VIT1/CCC1 family predicted Fe2+/Mn2+ transporter